MCYRPASPAERAAIICNPFFEERKSTHRVLVETARALAAAGVMTLRFDYRGHGDSDGGFSQFGPDEWRADVGHAAAWLRSECGIAPLALGLRLGATLALAAAADAGVAGLVLWQPVLHGRHHLRDIFRRKMVREMMTAGASHTGRDSLERALAAGDSVDLDGYVLTPEQFASISALEAAHFAEGSARDSLLVAIGANDKAAQDYEPLAEALSGSGCCEQRTVRLPPFWNLVGLTACPELIADTVAWVEGRAW